MAASMENELTETEMSVEERLAHEGPVYNWTTITDEFIQACSELDLGELLHDTSFGLFEAMSAIEMMDVKMDAGMMCNQTKRKVRNLEQSVEEDIVKIKDLTYAELVGIMDASLACIVTWLEGHSLAQTVFTNLYIHNPHIVEDRCLKAVSVCILKIVDVIRERVNRAGVFEEEDFQPMTYGFKMGSDITDMRAVGMMKEVEDDASRNMRNVKAKLQGSQKDQTLEEEFELCSGILSRLKFFRLLLSMLLAFGKEKCEGVPQAKKMIGQLLELIPPIRATVKLGIQPIEREVTKNDYPTIMGFEPLINQRLLPPTFPRYTIIHGRAESVDYVEALLHRLEKTTDVLNAATVQEVMEDFREFSKLSPCVLSRSVMQMLFLPPNRKVFGVHFMTDFIKDSIRAFVLPPALSQKAPIYNNAEVKQYVDALMTRAVRPVCSLLQITGHNRARQRDKWAHILGDMVSLQDEADKVDGYLHQVQIKLDAGRQYGSSFGTWVLYYTLQVMIGYIQAGFELELYAPYEYHYIYWYLYELLYSWLLSTIQRAESHVFDHEAYLENISKTRGKKTKRKKRSKATQRELTLCQAQQNMFGGYYKAVIGLKLANKLTQPTFEFDSEEVRYTHRFSPFACISTPPMVPYSQYREMTSLAHYNPILSASDLYTSCSNFFISMSILQEMTSLARYNPIPSASDLYTSSSKYFHQAKTLYEGIPNPSEEIQKVIRISKTNFVMMKLLSGGHKHDSQTPPEFDFSLHKLYPIIKV